MTQPGSCTWSDFEVAWRSVEELKEELLRTEVKLQRAAKPFTLENGEVDEDLLFAKSKHLNPKNPDLDDRKHKRRKVSHRHKNTHSTSKDLATSGGEPSFKQFGTDHKFHTSSEERPRYSHRSPSSRSTEKLKQKIIEVSLNRTLLKISSDEGSASGGNQLKQNSDVNKYFTRIRPVKYLREQGTQVDLAQRAVDNKYANNPTLNSGNSAVGFSEWERTYLNRELPGFAISGTHGSTSDLKQTVGRSASYESFMLKKPDTEFADQLKPMNRLASSQSYDAFSKVKEVIEKQKEAESRILREMDSTLFEKGLLDYPKTNFRSFRSKPINVLTNTENHLDTKSTVTHSKPTRKVAIAPPPAQYKGFSPIKSQQPESSLAIKGSLSPKVKIPKTKSQNVKRPLSPFRQWEIKTLRLDQLNINGEFHEAEKEEETVVRGTPQQENHAVPKTLQNHVEGKNGDDFLLNDNKTSVSAKSKTPEKYPQHSQSHDALNDTVDLTDSPPKLSEKSQSESNSLQDSAEHLKTAKRILEELVTSDTSTDLSDENDCPEISMPKVKKPLGHSLDSKKRKATKPPEPMPPAPKICHYDKEQVREYIEKQKLLRKKRLLEDKQKKKQAQEAKKKQLQALYEYQKLAVKSASKSKPTHPVKANENRVTKKFGKDLEKKKLPITSHSTSKSSPSSKTDTQLKQKEFPSGVPEVLQSHADADKSEEKTTLTFTKHSEKQIFDIPASQQKSHRENQNVGASQINSQTTADDAVDSNSKPKMKKDKIIPSKLASSLESDVNKSKLTKDKDVLKPEQNEQIHEKSSKVGKIQQSDLALKMADRTDEADSKKVEVSNSRTDNSEDDSLIGIPSLDISEGLDKPVGHKLALPVKHASSVLLHSEPVVKFTNMAASIQQQVKTGMQHLQDLIQLQKQMICLPSESTSSLNDSDALEEGTLESSPEMERGKIGSAILLKQMYASKTVVKHDVRITFPSAHGTQDKPFKREDGHAWKFPSVQFSPDPYNFINTWKRKPLVFPFLGASKDETSNEEHSNGKLQVPVRDSAEQLESSLGRTSYTPDFTDSDILTDASPAIDQTGSSAKEGTATSSAISTPVQPANGDTMEKVSPASNESTKSSETEFFGNGEMPEATPIPAYHQSSSTLSGSNSIHTEKSNIENDKKSSSSHSENQSTNTYQKSKESSEQIQGASEGVVTVIDGTQGSSFSSERTSEINKVSSEQKLSLKEMSSVTQASNVETIADESATQSGKTGSSEVPEQHDVTYKENGSEASVKPVGGVEVLLQPQTVFDPTTVTKVVAEAASAAATTAVIAALERKNLILDKKQLLQLRNENSSPSSKYEYSNDFEQEDFGVSSHPLCSTKMSQRISPADVVEEHLLNISSIKSSENDGNKQPVVPSSSASSLVTDPKVVESSPPISEEMPFVKKRNKSGNVSSPSPASLSDNDSLRSTALSSIQSSVSYVSQKSQDFHPTLPEESFAQLTLEMVRRMTYEEALRARHQLSLLEFQEKTLVEKARAEMKWLELLKKKLKEKKAEDKLPVIKKRQQELVMRLRQERAQLRCMQETYRSVSQKHQALLAEKKKLLTEPSSLAFQILKSDHSVTSHGKPCRMTSPSPSLHSVFSIDAEDRSVADEDKSAEIPEVVLRSSSSSAGSVMESQHTAVSKASLSSCGRHNKSSQSVPALQSESHMSHLSSHSLDSVVQGLKRLEANKRYLNKREQRLLQRRSRVESLLHWQNKLDNEEKEVKELEHKALEIMEKSKQKNKFYVSSSPSSPKNDADTLRTMTTKGSSASSLEEIHSGSAISSQIMSIRSEAKLNSIVPEEKMHFSPSSSTKVSEVLSVHSVSASESPYVSSSIPEDENFGRAESGAEEAIESGKGSSSSIAEDLNAEKLSTVSLAIKDKSVSSAEVYSESFESASDTPNTSSSPPQQKSTVSLSSVRKQETSGVLLPAVARSHRRHDSSGSDDSFTVSHSETASDQSDIEGRIYALAEELKRRKAEAEKLRKEQKRLHWEHLKEREISLKKQLEAYDKFIKEASVELEEQLQAAALSDSTNHNSVTVKPQIKQPRVAKSRHLQKQNKDEGNETSSRIKNLPLLPKERKPQLSSSYLAKKLRAIGTKDDSEDEGPKETAQSASSNEDELPQKSESSSPTIETKKPVFPKSRHLKELRKELETFPIVTTDATLVYSSDFTQSSSDTKSLTGTDKITSTDDNRKSVEHKPSDESSVDELLEESLEDSYSNHRLKDTSLKDVQLSNKSLDHLEETNNSSSGSVLPEKSQKCSDKSSTLVEEQGNDSDNSSKLLETSNEDSEHSSKKLQKNGHSTSGESFESLSPIEEEVRTSSESCSGSDGCSHSAFQKTKELLEKETEALIGESLNVLKPQDPPQTEKDSEKFSQPYKLAKQHATEQRDSIKHHGKEIVIDNVLDSLLESVYQDTISSVYQATLKVRNDESWKIANELSSHNDKPTIKSNFMPSLTSVHERAALLVSEDVTNRLLPDAIETVLGIFRQLVKKDNDVDSETSKPDIKSSLVKGNAEKYVSSQTDQTSASSVDAIYEFSSEDPFESIQGQRDVKTCATNDTSVGNEWFNESLVTSPSITKSIDAQLFVRQYPYLYRQIPNKPPPPYTPPSTPYSYIQEEEPEKPQEPTSDVQEIIDSIDEVVEEGVTAILCGKEQGLALCDITPPAEYCELDNLDKRSRNQRIFKTYIFELTKETALKIFNEKPDRPKPWLRNQSLTQKPLFPKSKHEIVSVLLKEIKKCMKISLPETGKEEQSIWSAMKLGRKKRDFVDTIIISELREEEAEWNNYDEDEFAIKLRLTDSIFSALFDDTVKTFSELCPPVACDS